MVKYERFSPSSRMGCIFYKRFMEIIAHTMIYKGGPIHSDLTLRNYRGADYSMYKKIYEDCFRPMRQALKLEPLDCCDSQSGLLQKADCVFILDLENTLLGSVAIYGNEIDDLIVGKDHQRQGYGQGLLRFAVAHMQSEGVHPIRLHVADWNQGAVRLYQKNGFVIFETEILGEKNAGE